MTSIIRIALSAWAFVWAFSFWGKTEGLRERLGIWYEYPQDTSGAFVTDGGPVNRWDQGGLGAWVNCPQCTALLAVLPAAVLSRFFPFLSEALAALGLAQLVVRWFESARVKARWWE